MKTILTDKEIIEEGKQGFAKSDLFKDDPERERFEPAWILGVMQVYYNTVREKLKEEQEINTQLLQNLKRITDRIEENNLTHMFPSAYSRAKEAIKQAEQ